MELKGTPDDLSKRHHGPAAQSSCVKAATEVGDESSGAVRLFAAPSEGVTAVAPGTTAGTAVAIVGMVPGETVTDIERPHLGGVWSLVIVTSRRVLPPFGKEMGGWWQSPYLTLQVLAGKILAINSPLNIGLAIFSLLIAAKAKK